MSPEKPGGGVIVRSSGMGPANVQEEPSPLGVPADKTDPRGNAAIVVD